MNIMNIPDGQSGSWKIETFIVPERSIENIRLLFQPGGRIVEPGEYKKLTYNGAIVMSNTPAELRDHSYFVYKAKDKVLINGLGLGCCLVEILEKEEVTSVTVIEISQHVINLVAPFFESDPRLEIIHADAFKWKPPKGIRYGAVWHDIFPAICSDNLPQMTRLHRKYGNMLKQIAIEFFFCLGIVGGTVVLLFFLWP